MEYETITSEQIEAGKALCAWNRVFGWIDNANNIDGEDKVKLMLLLDVIKPMIVKMDIPDRLYEKCWEELLPEIMKRFREIQKKAFDPAIADSIKDMEEEDKAFPPDKE